MANGAGQVHQVDPLQGEQVPLGHYAAQALVIHQADVGDMPFGHGHGGVEGAGLGLSRTAGRSCSASIGAVSSALASATTWRRSRRVKMPREALWIDDDDAADLLFVHQPHGFAQRGVRCAHHRVTHGQLA